MSEPRDCADPSCPNRVQLVECARQLEAFEVEIIRLQSKIREGFVLRLNDEPRPGPPPDPTKR